MKIVQEWVDRVYDRVFQHPVKLELIWLPIDDLGLNWDEIVFRNVNSIFSCLVSKTHPNILDELDENPEGILIGYEGGHKLNFTEFTWEIEKSSPEGITLKETVECIFRLIGTTERHPKFKINDYSNEIELEVEWDVLEKILEERDRK